MTQMQLSETGMQRPLTEKEEAIARDSEASR